MTEETQADATTNIPETKKENTTDTSTEDISNKKRTCIEWIEYKFKLHDRNSSWSNEIRAGFISFFACAYILAVNASIISETGGTCPTIYQDITSIEYKECKERVRLDLITATAASSCITTLFMGIFGNLPLAMAPGMGINAYFTYNVVGVDGSGNVSYSTALTAVLIEGIIFLIMALTNFRIYIAKMLPDSIKDAITVGIGLFLAHIGLQSSNGIGLIVGDPATKVTLGGCGLYNEINTFGVPSYCDTKKIMTGATTWLGIIGLILISILMYRKVKGSILIGILLISFISWIPGTPFTYFPDTIIGQERFNYFKKVIHFHPIQEIFAVFFKKGFAPNFKSADVWLALFTFFYVDILDTTGTLYSMAQFSEMLDKNGDFEGSYFAFIADSIGTIIASFFGSSETTTYIESASGITEGGKTGITAIIISIMFFISLFFTPIFASIPPWATGPALIIVGCMMCQNVTKIDWNDMSVSIPAFICIILMPLTYSIAYGIIGGLFMHLIMFIINWIIDKLCGKKCISAQERSGEIVKIDENNVEIEKMV